MLPLIVAINKRYPRIRPIASSAIPTVLVAQTQDVGGGAVWRTTFRDPNYNLGISSRAWILRVVDEGIRPRVILDVDGVRDDAVGRSPAVQLKGGGVED